MERSQLLILFVAAFVYYATAQGCTTPSSQLYIFPYSQAAGGFVNQPMTQLNINATARANYLTNFTWVVTQIPQGLQYAITADKYGIYVTGTPVRAGSYTMNVILYYWDNSQSKQSCSTQPVNFIFECSNPVVVTPSEGTLTGTAYNPPNFHFSAQGGFGSGYNYTANPQTINGVTIQTDGTLTGTWTAPVSSGSSFFLTVVDTGNCQTVVQYTLNVACPSITISPNSVLPNGLTTSFYNASLSSSGGLAPYAYSLQGTLPSGFTLSGNGYVSGNPTAATGAAFVVVTNDAYNCTGSTTLTFSISCPTISLGDITNSILVDRTYSSTVTASGGNGPYTFQVNQFVAKRNLPTALPAGLLIDSNTGIISGSPTATGTYEFMVIATDSKGCSGSKTYTIQVSCGTLSIGSITATGTATNDYSVSLTTTNGTADYTYLVTSGTLPPGLALKGSALMGTFSKNGTYDFVVSVIDARSCTANREFSFTIGCPTLHSTFLTRHALATKTYISVLTVDGGIAPFHLLQYSGLPTGIENDLSNFNFAGTPTQVGEFNVSLTIADDNGCSNNFYMPLTVSCAAFTFGNIQSSASVDLAYESSIVASSSVGPVTYSVVQGSLPNGLTLNSDGTIIGTPTKSGYFTFQIQAVDANGCTNATTRSISVDCTGSKLAVNSSAAPGQTGVHYTNSFSGSGSSHLPYTYAIQPIKTSYPKGVQKQTPLSDYLGWSECTALPYNSPLTDGLLSLIGEICGRAKYMMLACGNSSGTFYNLAAGETAVVMANNMAGAVSNNVTWYKGYANELDGAWGFADQDAALDIMGCDNADGDTRTCWRVSNVAGGYRCGDAVGLDTDSTWYRYVYFTNLLTTPLDLQTTYSMLTNGTLYGLPTIAGYHKYEVTVVDDAGCTASSQGTLQIDCGRFYAQALGTAQVSIAYNSSLIISGGSGSYRAVITGLPEGLQYDSENNILSGVPVVHGEFGLTIQITDLLNPCTYTITPTLVVLCPPNYLSDIPTVAQVGTTYLTRITYRNMLPPVHFIVGGGMLPYGVTLYRDGTLEGVPSLPGNYEFVIYLIQDIENGCSDSRRYEISVVCGPVDISDISNHFMLGDTVEESFRSSNGIQQYTYSLNSGALPDGLALGADGNVSGIATKAGFFPFSVRAEDTYNCFGVRHFVVAITCTAPLALAVLPTNAMAGERILYTTTVLGGVAPYTFSVLLGELPSGLTLNRTGHISGTIGAVGTYVFQLGVKDSQGCVATEVYTFTVAAAPVAAPPVVVSPPVTNTPVGTPKNTTETGNAPVAALHSAPAAPVSGHPSSHAVAFYLVVILLVIISL